MKLKFVIFFLLMSLASFAFSQPSGFSLGPPAQQWGWPACPSGSIEAFALGFIRLNDNAVIDEGDDFLEIATPVQPALCVLTTSYTTLYPHNVQGIDIQMGSGINAIMEWAVWIDILTPQNKHYRLRQQFDKHTDTRGNQVRYFPVQYSVPAGTVITIRRPSVICVGFPEPGIYNPSYPLQFDPYDQNNCATGQSITFVGK